MVPCAKQSCAVCTAKWVGHGSRGFFSLFFSYFFFLQVVVPHMLHAHCQSHASWRLVCAVETQRCGKTWTC